MPAVDFKALFIEERERRRKQQQQSEQEAAGGKRVKGLRFRV
jgi:hypothetical protein